MTVLWSSAPLYMIGKSMQMTVLIQCHPVPPCSVTPEQRTLIFGGSVSTLPIAPVVIVATLGVSYDRITATTYNGRLGQVGQYSSAILIAALCNYYGFPVSTISVHELHVTRCQLQAWWWLWLWLQVSLSVDNTFKVTFFSGYAAMRLWICFKDQLQWYVVVGLFCLSH